jgi:hypothetical protein
MWEFCGEEKQSAKKARYDWALGGFRGPGPGERGAANRARWAAITGASGLRHPWKRSQPAVI